MKLPAILCISVLAFGVNANAQGIKPRYGDGGGRITKGMSSGTSSMSSGTSSKSSKKSSNRPGQNANAASESIAREELCPTGEESCCGLSLEECGDLAFPYQVQFQETVLGDVDWREVNLQDEEDDPITLAVPLNLVQDQAVRNEQVGEYDAMTPDGMPFTFRMEEIVFTSAKILQQEVSFDQEELDLIASSSVVQTVFRGSIGDSSLPFVGSVVSSLDPTTGDFVGILVVLEDEDYGDGTRHLEAIYDQEPPSSGLRRKLMDADEFGCTAAVEATRLAFQCQNPADVLTQDEGCETNLIDACEAIVWAAQQDYKKAVETAEQIYFAAMEAYNYHKQIKKAEKLAAISAKCRAQIDGRGKKGVKTRNLAIQFLGCVGLEWFKGWLKREAKKVLADAARARAISTAVQERDAIIAAAVEGAEGISSKTLGCFQCCDAEDACSCKDGDNNVASPFSPCDEEESEFHCDTCGDRDDPLQICNLICCITYGLNCA